MGSISDLWTLNTLEAATNYLHQNTPLHLQNFINNEFCDISSPSTWIESHNPRTGKVLAKIPQSDSSEVERAVQAASKAFPAWSQTPRSERSNLLLRIATIIQEKREVFAVLESIDQGKTLARARIEVDRAISNFRFVPHVNIPIDEC